MARIVKVLYTDDIDGTEGARPVEFSIGGDSYTIDLSESNEQKLRALLAPYVEVADKVTKRASRAAGGAKKTSNAKVREWARANGYKVSDRGRISAEIVAAYEAAH